MSQETEDQTKHPGGRPSKYTSEMAVQAEKLCRLGATDQELADFFDVTEQTINNWKHQFPEFFESIKRGKVESDAEVADRLYHRAVGFEWDEQEPIKTKTVHYENGKRLKEEEEITLVTVHRVIPPDPTSAIFW